MRSPIDVVVPTGDGDDERERDAEDDPDRDDAVEGRSERRGRKRDDAEQDRGESGWADGAHDESHPTGQCDHDQVQADHQTPARNPSIGIVHGRKVDRRTDSFCHSGSNILA